MSKTSFSGKFFVPGDAKGELVKSERPISFWGGLDPESGRVIDRRSDVNGRSVADKIFAFPEGIGSSTTSAVLLQAVKNETSPAGIVNVTTEPILVSGALVLQEIYGVKVPVVSIEASHFDRLEDGDELELDGGAGKVKVL